MDLGATFGYPSKYLLDMYYHMIDVADLMALRNDWMHGGIDLKYALEEYGQEVTKEEPGSKKSR